MYELDIKQEADKIFRRLSKKNKKQLMTISKKIEDIKSNPHHIYKFLRKPLQSFNRIHIDKHFVLIFKINHNEELIEVYYFGHHNGVYRWLPPK